MRGFIFFFSRQLWPCCGSGARGHSWGSKGDGGGVRGTHRGVFVRHSHPHPPVLVGGTVMAASLQASVLPVYWLFYTVKSNKTELLSYNHLGT